MVKEDSTIDFSKNLSEEQIHNWLVNLSPKEINSAIANALKSNIPNEKLDYLTSMMLVSRVNQDAKFRGNADFLKIVLGHDTYKEMATTSHLAAGYYDQDNDTVPISDTYTVTQRYRKWSKLLKI